LDYRLARLGLVRAAGRVECGRTAPAVSWRSVELRSDDDHRVPSLRPRRPPERERRRHYEYLLDLDPDLGSGLDMRMRLVARPAVTAVTFTPGRVF
jgi:hypothetical protein